MYLEGGNRVNVEVGGPSKFLNSRLYSIREIIFVTSLEKVIYLLYLKMECTSVTKTSNIKFRHPGF